MAAPFRFLDRIDVLVDGPASVLTTVRQLVLPGGDRPVTRASDASRIPADDVRRHVVGVALDVVTERVRDGLVEALREHLDEVRAEYEMLEGERWDNESHADNALVSEMQDEWDTGFHQAAKEAFRSGDIYTALGDKLDHVQSTPERIADAVLANTLDPDFALARVGVGSADVDALVAEIRRPAQGPQQFDYAGEKLPVGATRDRQVVQILSLDELAMHVQLLCMEADAPSVACLQEGVTYVLTDPDMVATGAELLGLAGDAAFLAWAEERLITSTPQEDAAAVAEVLRLAGANAEGGDDPEVRESTTPETAAGGDEGAPQAAYTASIKFSEHPQLDTQIEMSAKPKPVEAPPPSEESDLTRAVGAALAALYDHGCETDKAMAEALGVPKTTINHSRHGKAPWAPSLEQFDVLHRMVNKHANPLQWVTAEMTKVRPA